MGSRSTTARLGSLVILSAIALVFAPHLNATSRSPGGAAQPPPMRIPTPLMLESLTCNPASVPHLGLTYCTATLSAPAPDYIYLNVTTNSSVMIGMMIPFAPGARSAQKDLKGFGIGPQPTAVTLQASYGGPPRTTQIIVGPRALKTASLAGAGFRPRWRSPSGSMEGGDFFAHVHVQLLAPAPSAGGNLVLRTNPDTVLRTTSATRIAGGSDRAEPYLFFHPVAADTQVWLVVDAQVGDIRDHMTGNVPLVVVRAARVGQVKYADNPAKLNHVPSGGVEAKMEAWLEGLPPNAAKVALSYSPPSLITGPATVTIPKNNVAEDFKVRVYPCTQAECRGTVRATYLGAFKEATLVVRQ